MNKNPIAAFLLSFIPGLGHLYLGRYVRGVLYGGASFGPIFLLILMDFGSGGSIPADFAMLMIGFALVAAAINMLDMIITLLARGNGTPHGGAGMNRSWTGDGTKTYSAGSAGGFYGSPASAGEAGGGTPDGTMGGNLPYGQYGQDQARMSSPHWSPAEAAQQQDERFKTILLSFIPGLGHFQLGLMQRGLTFLISFFGLFAMIAFVSYMTREDGFFVFLLGLPVIVFYCIFDAIQQLNRKHRGETLVDRSIIEELDLNRQDGRKSKLVAMFLSIFPGAGHMYLGLQRRGLQLMAGFLFSIYIMDVLRLSIFMFLIPIIWFFSLFDALQLVSKHDREELQDIPLVGWLLNHQKWLGIAFIAFGGYYLLDRVVLQLLERKFPELHISGYFHQYFQLFVISTLLIGGGLRLLLGSSVKKEGDGQ
ncbi:hypothetical protein [Paenibacillus contaminans]|uniref:TM2 domain-containing protein n=1 Tax=Paenibacillus contaminans TaxID=450362 RepID=A0A329MDE9_9BACL|nr:hypothetical protein [Paenibacillus contaminans]RAV17326.1 hypothetical protein DQG23_27155 [Paenibacillus contaminans]